MGEREYRAWKPVELHRTFNEKRYLTQTREDIRRRKFVDRIEKVMEESLHLSRGAKTTRYCRQTS